MRVVHLVSNHKFTGPVDPALGLFSSLRDAGVDSRLIVGRDRQGAEGPVHDVLRERGIEALSGFELPKHRRPFVGRRDARRLVALAEQQSVDVFHAHLDHAHEVALRARRQLLRQRRQGKAQRVPLVVRSLYDATPPPVKSRFHRLYGGTDGVFVFGDSVGQALRDGFSMPADRVVRLSGAVSLERFHPRPVDESLRDRFGLPRDAIVVGIVARIQKHRRYEVLLEALRRVMAEVPNLYLLVLGRGTHAREIAHEPVKALGMENRVCLPGYVGGEDYPRGLSCFDMKIFLVPGSDGTCRAVREAMAMGIPMIVARRGLLPEIVEDGSDGLVIDDDIEGLRAAVHRLATDSELRRRLGQNALERARAEFPPERQAERVLESYGRWSANRDGQQERCRGQMAT